MVRLAAERLLDIRFLAMPLIVLFLSACIGGGDQKVAGPIDQTKKITANFETIIIAEGETKSFSIQLDKPTTEDLSLKWKISGGDSATRFQFTEGLTSISTNNSSVLISLIVNEDAIYNPDLSYTIALEEVIDHDQYFDFVPQVFVVTDNDPKPTISFNTLTSSGNENVSAASLPVSIDAVAGKAITVTYTLEAASTATETADFTQTGSFSIPAGSTAVNLDFTVVDDTDAEGNETVVLKINSIKYDAIDLVISGTNHTHTFTIVDDEITTIADPTALRLVDRASENAFPAQTGYTSEQEILIEIDGDGAATKWCLSTTQTTKPANGSATCVGGAGASNGWYTSDPEALDAFANGADIQLANTDGSFTYYIWVANASDDVNPNAVSATIQLDRVAPTLTVAQGSTDPATAFPINFDIQFSEALPTGSFTVGDLSFSGTALGVLGGVTTADETLFEYDITALGGNGTIIPFIAANSAFDNAGNPNTASTAPADGEITANLPEGTKIYRSVGPGNNLALSQGSDSGGNNLVIDASSMAVFEKSIVDNIGVGDALVYDSDNNSSLDAIAFVHERYSDTALLIKSESGANVPAMSTADQDWVIYRAYTSLANAEAGTVNPNISVAFDAWTGGRDLVTSTESWYLALYADAVDSTAVTIDGWTMNGFHRLTLFVPYKSSHVGVSQRHSGVWDTSKFTLTQSGSDSSLLVNTSMDYVTLDGLQIESNTAGAGKAVRSLGPDFTMKNSILKKGGTGVSQAARFEYDSADVHRFDVYNNLIQGFNGATDEGLSIVSTSVNVEFHFSNNTIVDCAVNAISGTTTSKVVAINNIAQCSGTTSYNTTFHASSSNNLSNDTTAPGTSSVQSATVDFVNSGAGDYRLALTEANAIGSGKDLSSVFDTDARSRRILLPYDMGAFQSNLSAFTWTGAGGDNNWSTAANWHGGAAPSAASDIAIFNYLCNASCTSNIDSNVSIDSLILENDYTGTITQNAGVSLDFAEYFHVLGGSFIGGNQQITVNSGADLYSKKWEQSFIVNDANFTSTSDKLQILYSQDYLDVGFLELNPLAKTLNFNSGSIELAKTATANTTSGFSDFILRKQIEVNDLLFTGNAGFQSYKLNNPTYNKLVVGGNLSFTEMEFYGDTKIQLKGNLVNSTGYTNANVGINHTIEFTGTNAQTYSTSATSQAMSFIVNKAGGSVTPLGGTTHLNLSSLRVDAGSFTAPSGDLEFSYPSNVGLTSLNVFDIRVASGFIHNSGRILLKGDDNSEPLMHFLAVTGNPVNNIQFDATASPDDITIDFRNSPNPIEVLGDLNLNAFRLMGSVKLASNLNFGAGYGTSTDSGDLAIEFNGTANQFVQNPGAATYPSGNWVVNKASGSLSIEEAGSLASAGQDMDVQAGTIYTKGNFTVTDNLNLNVGTHFYTMCNTLTRGSLTGTGNLYAGDVAANLNLSVADISVNEDSNLVFTIASDNFACDADITIDYATTDSTAHLWDNDYTATTGTATLSQGAVSVQVTVPVIDDTFWEENEDVLFNISNQSTGTITDAQAIGTILANDAAGATYVWTGLGADDNWSTPGNWQGGVAPGAGDIAYFDSSCTNCNVNIDTNTTVGGVRVHSTYTGTVTQLSGQTLTMDTYGWYQSGGSFVGGDSAVSISGILYLNNANFTASSGTTTLNSEMYTDGTGTKNFAGTLDVVGSTDISLSPGGGTVFNNVLFNRTSSDVNIIGEMDINGDLTLNMTSNTKGIDGGKILLSGNLYGTGGMFGGSGIIEFDTTTTQTIDVAVDLPEIIFNATGTINIINDLYLADDATYISGTVNASAADLIYHSGWSYNSNNSGTKNWDLQNMAFNSITFDIANTKGVNFVSDLSVTDLLINRAGTNSTLNNSAINIAGDIICAGGTFGGTTTLKMNNTTPKSFTNTGVCYYPSIEFNSTAAVSITGNITFCNNFTNNATGLVSIDNSKVSMSSSNGCAPNYSFTSGGINFYDLSLYTNSYGSTIVINDDINVTNDLSIGITNGSSGAGKISVQGDVEFKGKAYSNTLVINGTSDQRIYSTYSSMGMNGTFEINSTGGTVTLDSETSERLKFNRDFTYTAGTVVTVGQTVFGGVDLSGVNANTINAGSIRFQDVLFDKGNYDDYSITGTLYVDGDLRVDNSDHVAAFGEITSGIIELKGDYSNTQGRTGGATLKFVGDAIQKISQTNGYSDHFASIVIDKTGGFVYQDTNVNRSISPQALDIQNGIYRMNGYNLTIHSALNIEAAQEMRSDCGTLSYGSLTGTGTVSAGITSAATLRLYDTTVEEGVGDAKVYAVLDLARCDRDTFFDAVTRSNTATESSDYSYVNTNSSIAMNRMIAEITIPVLDDTIPEATENLYVDATAVDAEIVLGDTEGQLNITDNDVSNFKWVGTSGDGLWSTAANWSGGAVPGTTDTAVFDSGCGANCNASIDSSIEVGGIVAESTYTGTLTQSSGNTIDVNHSFEWNAGTFTGGNSDFNVDGNFSVNGGSFNSTSSKSIIDGNFVIAAAATYTDNSSAYDLGAAAQDSYIDVSGFEFNDLNITKSGNSIFLLKDIVVNGTFNTSGSTNLMIKGQKRLELKSNADFSNVAVNKSSIYPRPWSATIVANGTGSQNFDFGATGYVDKLIIDKATGSLSFTNDPRVAHEYEYIQGTVDYSGKEITFGSGDCGSQDNTTIKSNGLSFNNVKITKDCGYGVSFLDDMTVTGNLLVDLDEDASGTATGHLVTAVAAKINVAGDLQINGIGKVTNATDDHPVIVLNGSGAQNLSTRGTGDFDEQVQKLEFAHTGTVNVLNDIFIEKSIIYTSGTVNWNATTLQIGLLNQGCESYRPDVVVDLNTLNVGNVNINGNDNCKKVTLNSNLTSTGNIVVVDSSLDLNGNTMTSAGTITLEAAATIDVNGGSTTPAFGSGSFIDNGGTYNP